MKELSLHLLDVAKNSVAAGAEHISITLDEDQDGWLTIAIADDGRGMEPEFLARVTHHPHHPEGRAGPAPAAADGGADRRLPGYSKRGGHGHHPRRPVPAAAPGLSPPGGSVRGGGPAHPGQPGRGMDGGAQHPKRKLCLFHSGGPGDSGRGHSLERAGGFRVDERISGGTGTERWGGVCPSRPRPTGRIAPEGPRPSSAAEPDSPGKMISQ